MRFHSMVLPAFLFMACCLNPQTSQSSSAPPKPDDMPCGMIYGKDHFLSLCAPPGWLLDDKVLADQGVYAAFYRAEFTYQEAVAHHTLMYLNVVLKDKGQQTAVEMMKLDAEQTKRASPDLVVQKTEPILIPGDKGRTPREVPVQTLLNDYGGSYESIAYIEDEKTISLVVISSVSSEQLHQDYASFVKLVQSYSFIGSNVKIEKKN